MADILDKIEDNSSKTIRAVRIFLLVVIVLGLVLLFTQPFWVPKLINYLLVQH